MLCDSYLLAHGGHRYAAGISIREGRIEDFRDEFLSACLISKPYIRSRAANCYRCSMHPDGIDGDLISQFEMLAPFGSMNPEPVLYAKQVQVSSLSVAGNRHLRMRISGDGVSRNSIWFGKSSLLSRISEPLHDIIFTPQMNKWNGSSSIQLKIRDMAAV